MNNAFEPVGIIGAMGEEVVRLRAGLEGLVAVPAGPFTVHQGRLEGVKVVLAECGVGKVNAAALTQLLIGMQVRSIVFTGVAGALDTNLEVGDVVIGDSAVQYDVDVTALGYRPGEVPGSGLVYRCDARLVELARTVAAERDATRVHVGLIASGDAFVSSPDAARAIREDFGALCAEMEGAACAQVCVGWNVPFVIVRSISDSADHSAQIDFRAFTSEAAERADEIVSGVLRRMNLKS